MYRIIAVIFIVTLSLCHFVATAYAETMFSESFQLRFGNFNMTSGNKTSTSYGLTDTVGQTVAEQFTSAGYALLAGSQYLYTLTEFSFSISTTSVDFGSLALSYLNQASLDLTVTAPRQGYSVTTIASSRLKNGTNYIADTSCNTSCSETSAGVWTNTTSYGFGYNMTGNDIASDFTGATYFRPFPDLSSAESAATIMTTPYAGTSRQATATLQLVLDPTQAVGTYQNQLYFIATPNY